MDFVLHILFASWLFLYVLIFKTIFREVIKQHQDWKNISVFFQQNMRDFYIFLMTLNNVIFRYNKSPKMRML